MQTTTETTTNSTAVLRHGITAWDGKNRRLQIEIKLDDECRNGHEDFSLTANIYEKHGAKWVDAGGGCCHDEILKLKPELKPFADLHLSTFEGIPMHAIGNAFYWFAGFNGGLGKKYHGGSGSDGRKPDQCREIFCDYVRVTDAECDAITAQSPRNEIELQAVLENMGLPERWKSEAQAAIRQLEEWTGARFESKATKQTFTKLTETQLAEIAERKASGYYSPEQVALRDAQAASDRKAKRIETARKEHAASLRKLENKLLVELWLAEFDEELNVIYYDHTGELSFNWSRGSKLVTKEEFEAIEKNAARHQLPEGIKFVWNANPKY